MRRLAVVLAIVTLAGCSSSTPAVKVDPSVAREASFLAAVDSTRGKLSDKSLLTVGYGVCKALENGTVQSEPSEVAVYVARMYSADYGTDVWAPAMKAELLCPNWNKPSS